MVEGGRKRELSATLSLRCQPPRYRLPTPNRERSPLSSFRAGRNKTITPTGTSPEPWNTPPIYAPGRAPANGHRKPHPLHRCRLPVMPRWPSRPTDPLTKPPSPGSCPRFPQSPTPPSLQSLWPSRELTPGRPGPAPAQKNKVTFPAETPVAPQNAFMG